MWLLPAPESQDPDPNRSDTDSYLKARVLPGSHMSLMLLVELPALPRNVDVELQPMCALHPGLDLPESDDSGVLGDVPL
jgi:hypothetical protein